jgi:hypothetical protein
MGKIEPLRKNLRRWACTLGALVLISCLAPSRSHAQAAVEAAGVMSNSAAAASAVTKVLPSSLPHPSAESNPAYVRVPVGPPADEVNRKALEQQAGGDAAKLLLRSVPTDAIVYVDGMFVGRTPLLLILPPGKRQVEMRGQRQDMGSGVVELAPKEARQFELTLTARYTASVTLHTHPLSVSTGSATTIGALPSTPSTPTGMDSLEAMNLKNLEQNAGKDAAKLVVRSVPDDAVIYIDGMLVGHAPLQLIVAPGKHKVELHGQRGESGERLVGLLPSETQQLELTLAPRYPANVTLP